MTDVSRDEYFHHDECSLFSSERRSFVCLFLSHAECSRHKDGLPLTWRLVSHRHGWLFTDKCPHHKCWLPLRWRMFSSRRRVIVHIVCKNRPWHDEYLHHRDRWLFIWQMFSVNITKTGDITWTLFSSLRRLTFHMTNVLVRKTSDCSHEERSLH